jgi:hypothetical protein
LTKSNHLSLIVFHVSSLLIAGGSIMKQDLQQKAIVEGQDIYLSSETGNLPCLMVAYLAMITFCQSLI